MGKDEPEFLKRHTQILGLSRDSAEAHRRFAANTGASFPLLIDTDGVVSKAYGATMPLIPVTARKLFVIDRSGTVRHVVDGMPDDQQLLAVLDQLEAEHEAEKETP